MSASVVVATALLLGGSLGIGIWSLIMVLPRWAAPSLTRRIAPYVRDVTDANGTTVWGDATIDPGAVMAQSASRTWHALRRRLVMVIGGSAGVRRRLIAAGREPDVVAYRTAQVTWMLAAAGAGCAVVLVLVAMGAFTVPSVAVPLATAAAGWLYCEARLTAAAQARISRIEEEVPTVLEFLALCLSAGEAIFDSIDRVARGGEGELSREFRRVILAARTGSSLPDALTAMAARLDIAPLTRAVDHLIAGIDRGAPLAAILQDQAADAREHSKRSLIEIAGRKEIAMLIPLVFGMLPMSVLFAVFPGIVMLRLGVG